MEGAAWTHCSKLVWMSPSCLRRGSSLEVRSSGRRNLILTAALGGPAFYDEPGMPMDQGLGGAPGRLVVGGR